jgi:glutathione S-transferase
MAAFLPFNDVAGLPLEDYPSVGRWYRRLEGIDAWRDRFEGLNAPGLPPVPGHARPA